MPMSCGWPRFKPDTRAKGHGEVGVAVRCCPHLSGAGADIWLLVAPIVGVEPGGPVPERARRTGQRDRQSRAQERNEPSPSHAMLQASRLLVTVARYSVDVPVGQFPVGCGVNSRDDSMCPSRECS